MIMNSVFFRLFFAFFLLCALNAEAGFFDKKCITCKHKTSKKNKVHLCKKHWLCPDCSENYIEDQLKKEIIYATCIKRSCKNNVNIKDLIEDSFLEYKNQLLEIDRYCKICDEYIPKDKSRYFSCDDHFSCRACMKENIEKYVSRTQLPKCNYCNALIDLDFIERYFPKSFEKINNFYSNCEICYSLILNDKKIYHCDDHWSCDDCYENYVKQALFAKRIPIQCFAMDCNEELKLSQIEELMPNEYIKIISWYDEETIDIEEHIQKNYNLLQELMLSQPNSYTQCPHCKMIVNRISGCDGMICKNCNYHFDFRNGRERFFENFKITD